MSVWGVYFGHGIEITKNQLATALDVDVDDLSENNISYLQRRFYPLENYKELHDKIDNMDLLVIEKDHDENNIYFGYFIEMSGYNWGMTEISDQKKLEIANIMDDYKFKNICLQLFDIEPKLITIVSGCRCCT